MPAKIETVDVIAELFARFTEDHRDAIRGGFDSARLIDSVDRVAILAGRQSLKLRGAFGDGRKTGDAKPDTRHMARPGIDPGAVGWNVRCGFDWENKVERGSDEHARRLWIEGMVREWIPYRIEDRFVERDAGKRAFKLYSDLKKNKIRGEAKRRDAAIEVLRISCATCAEFTLILKQRPNRKRSNHSADTLARNARAHALYKQHTPLKEIRAICNTEFPSLRKWTVDSAVSNAVEAHVNYYSDPLKRRYTSDSG